MTRMRLLSTDADSLLAAGRWRLQNPELVGPLNRDISFSCQQLSCASLVSLRRAQQHDRVDLERAP